MRIFNIMMSGDLGGIQQAYIDYHDALKLQKHEVINITRFNADINKKLPHNHTLPNLLPWCFLSKIYLWILVAIYKPDMIICHGNRAISFSLAAKRKHIPLVGVSHNYSYKYLRKCDYILTLTNKLKNHLIHHGIDQKRLFSISNMVRVTRKYVEPKPYRTPLVIGSFGRFVANKGFIYLIEAIKLLKQNGHNVHLLLGGDGPDKDLLLKRTKELNLEKNISFDGWLQDKDTFFQKLDLFCLPSVIEPFGIIALEVMSYSKPLITTKSGGPEETLRDGIDGLLAEIESAEDLADKLSAAINNYQKSVQMAKSAHSRLKENYDIKIVAKRLSEILGKIKNEF